MTILKASGLFVKPRVISFAKPKRFCYPACRFNFFRLVLKKEVFMQFMTFGSNLISNIENWAKRSIVHRIVFCLCLSWFYALCSQCLIPLPLNLVPVTLQSVMFLFCAWIFGYAAVNAYFMYLLQGLFGAPFFSRFGSGAVHLLGPTGGYLIGFGVAMLVMVFLRDLELASQTPASKIRLLISYWFCCILYYVFGLLQLACFVPSNKVLALGLYPFILGDFVVKAIFILILTTVFQRRRS